MRTEFRQIFAPGLGFFARRLVASPRFPTPVNQIGEVWAQQYPTGYGAEAGRKACLRYKFGETPFLERSVLYKKSDVSVLKVCFLLQKRAGKGTCLLGNFPVVPQKYAIKGI